MSESGRVEDGRLIVTGRYTFEDALISGYQTSGSDTIPLDTLSINFGRVIYEHIGTTGGGTHAFIYTNGAMTDLNTYLPSGSGWVLEAATAINGSQTSASRSTISGGSEG